MNYDELKTELAKPTYADLSDAAAAEALNAATIDGTQPITSAELLAWAGGSGRYARIATAVDNTELSDALRSVAMVARKLIERDGTSLDLSLADRAAMVEELVTGAVLTADDKTSLEALAAVKISRAGQLGLPTIREGHVQQARMSDGE